MLYFRAGATTFGWGKFSRMTLSIKDLFVTLSTNNTHHENTLTNIMLSLVFFIVILNVVIKNVYILAFIMLSVIVLNFIMLNVVMLNVVMLNVVMLNVIMLSVVAPHHPKVKSLNTAAATGTKRKREREIG
jgi:hypothetical protein